MIMITKDPISSFRSLPRADKRSKTLSTLARISRSSCQEADYCRFEGKIYTNKATIFKNSKSSTIMNSEHLILESKLQIISSIMIIKALIWPFLHICFDFHDKNFNAEIIFLLSPRSLAVFARDNQSPELK